MASIVPSQISFMFHHILSAHNKLNIFERCTAPRSITYFPIRNKLTIFERFTAPRSTTMIHYYLFFVSKAPVLTL